MNTILCTDLKELERLKCATRGIETEQHKDSDPCHLTCEHKYIEMWIWFLSVCFIIKPKSRMTSFLVFESLSSNLNHMDKGIFYELCLAFCWSQRQMALVKSRDGQSLSTGYMQEVINKLLCTNGNQVVYFWIQNWYLWLTTPDGGMQLDFFHWLKRRPRPSNSVCPSQVRDLIWTCINICLIKYWPKCHCLWIIVTIINLK